MILKKKPTEYYFPVRLLICNTMSYKDFSGLKVHVYSRHWCGSPIRTAEGICDGGCPTERYTCCALILAETRNVDNF